jgi:hypothetical protein
VFGPSPIPVSTFVYYVIQEGDRFDNLAFKLYGAPDYWWKLADANPEVFYPDNLMAGSIIRIPTS